MSGTERAPELGAGLRHALALAVLAVLPIAYLTTSVADRALEDFPRWLVFGAALVTTVAAGVVSVAFPAPRLRQVLARIAILVAIALAIRLTVPSPGVAAEQILEREAKILTGPALVSLFLLGVAYTFGHGLAAGVARLATQARSIDLAREEDRRALIVWFWTTFLLVFVFGAFRGNTGPAPSIVLAVCAFASLLVLADLRLRAPLPASARPPIVAAPLRIRALGVALAALAIVAGTALVAPLVPVESLRDVPSISVDWFTLERPAREAGEAVTTEIGERQERSPAEGLIPDDEPAWTAPQLPLAGIGLLALVGLLLLLRPHRWRRGLQRLIAIVRGSRLLGADDAVGELGELEDLDEEDTDRRGRGRVRRMLDRVRPRPRDPRSAVLHDYFHVERLLARQEQGREPYETPHEHAIRIHVGTAHERLADLAADARFGRNPPAPELVDESRDLRRLVEEAVRERQRTTSPSNG